MQRFFGGDYSLPTFSLRIEIHRFKILRIQHESFDTLIGSPLPTNVRFRRNMHSLILFFCIE